MGALTLTGCANWKQIERADGPVDLAMAFVGKAQPDVAPIEKIAGGAGGIATVRAVQENGGISVRGSVRRGGLGTLNTYSSHVDVVVLDASRRVVYGVATDYSPADIPYTYHGIEGRSRFSVFLTRPLPQGATIQIRFHNVPAKNCIFYDNSKIGK